MRTHNILGNDINSLDEDVLLSEMAHSTKNYTGAEIEAVIKSASSFSFEDNSNLMDFRSEAVLNQNSKVCKSIHFIKSPLHKSFDGGKAPVRSWHW